MRKPNEEHIHNSGLYPSVDYFDNFTVYNFHYIGDRMSSILILGRMISITTWQFFANFW